MRTDVAGTASDARTCVRIPPLYSPFSSAIHPAHVAINRRTGEWAERIGLGPDALRQALVRHDIGTFAARVLPRGNQDVVQLLGDFIIWLFGVDDGCCEEGELGRRPGELAGELSRLLRVAQDPDVDIMTGSPLAAGLRDLRRRVDQYGSASQAARWVDGLREYFLSVVWEARYRECDLVPSINDYTLMRLYDGATSAVPPLLEMAHGYELGAVRDTSDVRAVTEMAYFVICWDNDLFSLSKERWGGHYWLNAVRVVAHHLGITLDDAVRVSVATRDRVTSHYLRLCERLAARDETALHTYIATLDSFIRGAQDWGITSSRYRTSVESVEPAQAFADQPSGSGDEALRIAAVEWWWRQPGADASHARR